MVVVWVGQTNSQQAVHSAQPPINNKKFQRTCLQQNYPSRGDPPLPPWEVIFPKCFSTLNLIIFVSLTHMHNSRTLGQTLVGEK